MTGLRQRRKGAKAQRRRERKRFLLFASLRLCVSALELNNCVAYEPSKPLPDNMDAMPQQVLVPRKTFYHRAATFCLLAPFIGIVINFFGALDRAQHPPQNRMELLADITVNAFVPVLGVLAGIISLFGIRSYGKTGILWKTVAGLLIFTLMVLAAIPSVMKARQISRQRYEQRYGHPLP